MSEIRAAAKALLGLLEGLMAKPEQIVFAAGAGSYLEAVKVDPVARDYADGEVPRYDLSRRYRLIGFPLVLDPFMGLDRLVAAVNGRPRAEISVTVSSGCRNEGVEIVNRLREGV